MNLKSVLIPCFVQVTKLIDKKFRVISYLEVRESYSLYILICIVSEEDIVFFFFICFFLHTIMILSIPI